MSLLRKLFGSRPAAAEPAAPEHAVIVAFDFGSSDPQPVFDLSTRLEQAIAAAGAGEFDGNELAADGSDGTLYMYGPDADRLFAAVRPVLEAAAFMQGARVKLRYGPAGSDAPARTIVLGAA
jgi:hypothetical protein